MKKNLPSVIFILSFLFVPFLVNAQTPSGSFVESSCGSIPGLYCKSVDSDSPTGITQTGAILHGKIYMGDYHDNEFYEKNVSKTTSCYFELRLPSHIHELAPDFVFNATIVGMPSCTASTLPRGDYYAKFDATATGLSCGTTYYVSPAVMSSADSLAGGSGGAFYVKTLPCESPNIIAPTNQQKTQIDQTNSVSVKNSNPASTDTVQVISSTPEVSVSVVQENPDTVPVPETTPSPQTKNSFWQRVERFFSRFKFW